jgi:hypothetical protein
VKKTYTWITYAVYALSLAIFTFGDFRKVTYTYRSTIEDTLSLIGLKTAVGYRHFPNIGGLLIYLGAGAIIAWAIARQLSDEPKQIPINNSASSKTETLTEIKRLKERLAELENKSVR